MNSGRCLDPITRTTNLHLGSYLDQLKKVSRTSMTWPDPLLCLRVNIVNQVVQRGIRSAGFLESSNPGVEKLLETSYVV